MASRLYRLIEQGKLNQGCVPPWLTSNVMLEVIMGSRAYGVAASDKTDYDIRGIFIPPKNMPFPATEGLIVGYDDIKNCEHWNPQEKLKDNAENEFDFDIHSITKFFRLAQEANPNQIDLLYAPEHCITHCTLVGRMIVDNRNLFLSKLIWKRYRGYACHQMKSIQDKINTNGVRKEIIEKYGYDTKFAYHTFRLLTYAEQMLTEGHLDLNRDSGEFKAIRNGEWSYAKFEEEFLARKVGIEKAYHDSKLPELPNYTKIRELLLSCLEQHYGTLGKTVVRVDAANVALQNIDKILNDIRPLLYTS